MEKNPVIQEDYMKDLLRQENGFNLKKVQFTKEYTCKNRVILYTWFIQHLNEIKQFSRKGKELAYYYFDNYLQSYDIYKEQLQLLAVCCIKLAVKFEERFDYNTRLAMDATNNQYSIKEIEQMEINIIKNLQWKLSMCMPSDFIEIILSYYFPQLYNSKDFLKQVYKQLDLCQINYIFIPYKPSSKAIGVVFYIISQYEKLHDYFDYLEKLILESLDFDQDQILEIYQILNSMNDQDEEDDEQTQQQPNQQQPNQQQQQHINTTNNNQQITNFNNLNNNQQIGQVLQIDLQNFENLNLQQQTEPLNEQQIIQFQQYLQDQYQQNQLQVQQQQFLQSQQYQSQNNQQQQQNIQNQINNNSNNIQNSPSNYITQEENLKCQESSFSEDFCSEGEQEYNFDNIQKDFIKNDNIQDEQQCQEQQYNIQNYEILQQEKDVIKNQEENQQNNNQQQQQQQQQSFQKQKIQYYSPLKRGSKISIGAYLNIHNLQKNCSETSTHCTKNMSSQDIDQNLSLDGKLYKFDIDDQNNTSNNKQINEENYLQEDQEDSDTLQCQENEL